MITFKSNFTGIFFTLVIDYQTTKNIHGWYFGSGVQTLVVSDSGYLLLKQHFDGGNSQKLGEKKFTSNTGNMSINTIELLNQQLAIKDTQIKEKDEQLKSMQKLLDQSQQLQLMAERKIEKFKAITSKQSKHDNPNLNNANDLKQKNAWWHFW